MSLLRILKTTAITLSHTFVVDGEAADAVGNISIAVKRLDGTTVASGTATKPPGTTGVYTWALAASATLDTLTVDWSGIVASATVTVRDYVEVVGEFLFGLDQAYDDLSLSTAIHPLAEIAAKRIGIEQECERICRQAFVPRFERETLSGNGSSRLVLKHMLPRALRVVSISGVAMSAPDVAAVGLAEHGVLTRPGGVPWPAGLGNVVVEYEHGRDMPPLPVREAGILRLRSLLGRPKSGVPDRTSSFTTPDGSAYRLTMPGAESTGIPDVDGAYQAFARKRRAVVA